MINAFFSRRLTTCESQHNLQGEKNPRKIIVIPEPFYVFALRLMVHLRIQSYGFPVYGVLHALNLCP